MSETVAEKPKGRRVRRAHIAREFLNEAAPAKVADAETVEAPAATAAPEPAAKPAEEIWVAPATPSAATLAAAPATDYVPPAHVIAAEAAIVEKQGIGRPLAYAAAIAFALGLGWLGGAASRAPEADGTPRPAAFAEWKDAFQLGLGPIDEQTKRTADELALLRHRVEVLKEGFDKLSVERDLKALRQTAATLQNTVNDTVAKMQAPDRGPTMASLAERLDRIEKRLAQQSAQVQPAPAQPKPVAAVQQDDDVTGSVPKDKPKGPAIVDGWYLRGVDGEVALIQGRNGVREVIVGDTIPGLGRIDAIKRHGNSWAVLTSRGLIVPSAQ